LDVAGEGGGKHESLTVLNAWHILALHDTSDLWFETHVQHTISLIKNQVLDVAKGDTSTLDQIDETTWGSNEKITSTLDLAELRSNIGTTINDTWTNPRSVCKLARLIEDLRHKLTSGSKDQRGWVSLALAEVGTCGSWGSRRTVDEGLREDGEQEATRLSGTSLGTSHQITTTHDDWNGVLLDWCWNLVVSKFDVLEEMVIKGRVGEREDWLWDVLTGGLDWDIIVLLEVDTGLLLAWVVCYTEKLALLARVGWSSSVLAILPCTGSTTTGRAGTTSVASSTWVTIGISVEAWSLTSIVPALTTTATVGWRTVGSGLKIGSVGPVASRTRSIETASRCGPGTAVDTVWWRSTVGSLRRRSSTWLSTHVRRDVGTGLGTSVEVQAVHVQLFSHYGQMLRLS
jgi:hypothetical protein